MLIVKSCDEFYNSKNVFKCVYLGTACTKKAYIKLHKDAFTEGKNYVLEKLNTNVGLQEQIP